MFYRPLSEDCCRAEVLITHPEAIKTFIAGSTGAKSR